MCLFSLLPKRPWGIRQKFKFHYVDIASIEILIQWKNWCRHSHIIYIECLKSSCLGVPCVGLPLPRQTLIRSCFTGILYESHLFFGLLSYFSLFLLSLVYTFWRSASFSAISAFYVSRFANFLVAHDEWLLTALIALTVLFHRKLFWCFWLSLKMSPCSKAMANFSVSSGLSLGFVNTLSWTDAFFI